MKSEGPPETKQPRSPSMDCLKHFEEFGMFTNPGCYIELLRGGLPSAAEDMGRVVRAQFIHQARMRDFDRASEDELERGVKDKIPWYRQPEDAVLPGTASIVAELLRRDSRGFVHDRAVRDRLILTCRPVAIVMCSIFKSRGTPARVRAGFADYFASYDAPYIDHWITEYWCANRSRWIAVDVDGLDSIADFSPFDVPRGRFAYAADVWRDARRGALDPDDYWNAKGVTGLNMIAWQLFYDFHCLMNSESIYPHHPKIGLENVFPGLEAADMNLIDHLSELAAEPDENLVALLEIWKSSRALRLMHGTLLYN
ncbi:transglutaminase-like domain-containing protein [Actinoplanes sp. KI2]|uniref:transglutaminase-like domain-containing protein n=1 Tax=Actinoplanes sp. KI2 TaxID=2983315 RepID=UPI0021D5D1AA|nr:transglutaminase-like domain-containing protein [Actinoplanes sp. KI2]MCU7725624.1 transglutaminase-like domain-containing protein [Actinoplanes sp. KI2]